MSDLMQKIAEATQKLSELQKERTDLEASALAHETKAREDRRAMSQIKQDITAISIVLKNSQVELNIETANEAAERAKREAESLLAANREKQKQLDILLAEAKARAEAAAKVDAEKETKYP